LQSVEEIFIILNQTITPYNDTYSQKLLKKSLNLREIELAHSIKLIVCKNEIIPFSTELSTNAKRLSKSLLANEVPYGAH